MVKTRSITVIVIPTIQSNIIFTLMVQITDQNQTKNEKSCKII